MSQPSHLQPEPGLPFGRHRPRVPRFSGVSTRSYYLTLRDGVKLAIDVSLPADLPPGVRLPALLQQTRYWRSMELWPPLGWFLTADMLMPQTRPMKPFFTGRGYALVTADVRGTGASFGAWPHPWPEESIQDASEIVDWIVAQPWSNRQVGGLGTSYVGTTAELLGTLGHPAVRAILPMFNHPDPYTDIAFPGGILNRRFVEVWSRLDLTLDANRLPAEFGRLAGLALRGVKPVDGPEGRRLLAAAVIGHAANGDTFQAARRVIYRDDCDPALNMAMDDMAAYRRWPRLDRADVPIMGWASWLDAGTANAALRRFCTLDNARRAVIGAWDHGGLSHASPYRPANAPVEPALPAQWAEIVRFFDPYLQEGGRPAAERVLHYYTLGEERWHQSHTWPPAGVAMERWYLAPDGRLDRGAPAEDGAADVYTVDWEATTGLRNRWWEMTAALREQVIYSGRARAARHLLTYTTAPLPADTEITGHPVVTLCVTSSEPDCAFYAYLEDVNERGEVTYVTEGQLRSIHHPLSEQGAPPLPVPHHTFKQADSRPLVRGRVSEVSFGLLPTSVLIRKGHRLRLGIAGHDRDTFVRIPESATPEWRVERSRAHPSWIELPVRERA